MRSTLAALAFIASIVNAQSVDLAGLAAIPTGVFNIPVVYATVNGSAITATTLAASATASSDPDATSLVNSAARASVTPTSVSKREAHHKRDGTCAVQPEGIDYDSAPDTPLAFAIDPYYAVTAETADAPAGYTTVFTNLNASNSANKYMGYSLLSFYDVKTCASHCTSAAGCESFNIYFERDPSVSFVRPPNPTHTDMSL